MFKSLISLSRILAENEGACPVLIFGVILGNRKPAAEGTQGSGWSEVFEQGDFKKKSILRDTGSQYSVPRSGVMWSLFIVQHVQNSRQTLPLLSNLNSR